MSIKSSPSSFASNIHGASANPSVVILEFGKPSEKHNDGVASLNPLSRATRHSIYTQLETWKHNSSVSAIVLVGGGGRHFSAGADLSEFAQFNSLSDDHGKDLSNDVSLTELVQYIEDYPKPILAAIQGVALGGGLELALACHYRICVPTASLGLPEVHVGVIPGAGGTQRLPRLIGIQASLERILTGKPVSGIQAMELGLVNSLCPINQSLVGWAVKWAEHVLERIRMEQTPLPRLSRVVLDVDVVNKACNDAIRLFRLPSVALGGHGVHAALTALRASAGMDFEQGMKVEQEMFWESLMHPQGNARRHAFFAVRMAQKSYTKDVAANFTANATSTTTAKLSSPLLRPSEKVTVGVVGAGLMGSGIALVLLQTGFAVRLVDIHEAALQTGVQFVQTNIAALGKRKGKWSKDKLDAMMARLLPSTSLQSLKDCHLVIEAVLENMKIKHQVFETLGQVTPPEALLLSNTSTLSIDTIASVLSADRRLYCAGWHFFSPAHRMQLVEIVVGKETSGATIALLQRLTKQIGKIGVTVGNCHGFVGNRMVAPYTGEAAFLVASSPSEGEKHSNRITTIEEVDNALTNVHGMKMGPFAMSDLAGNDVGYYIRKEQGFTRDLQTGKVGQNRGSRRYTELVDDMVTELGRLGQKVGKGWYDYDRNVGKGRIGIPSREMADFIRTRYHHCDHPRESGALDAKSIVERILFPLVNEGFKILEEGVAQRPSDIDVIYIYGYGWPIWRGGPMYWADHEVGLPYLLQRLQEFYQQFPGSDWFRPSRLLETCVENNMTVEEYYYRKDKSQRDSVRSKL